VHSVSAAPDVAPEAVEQYHNMGTSPPVSKRDDRVSQKALRCNDHTSEDESRYNIPGKRGNARKGKQREEGIDIEFTTDDDASDGVVIIIPSGSESSDSSEESEEGEVEEGRGEDLILNVIGEDDNLPEPALTTESSPPASRSASVAQRRAYWMGKGGTT
jgi:hypothetical protein